jgi:alkylation response protein AidB-like acyl-CoA dehydrogenase
VTTYEDVRRDVDALAREWRTQRSERQARRALDRADFDALAAAGYLRLAVPREQGGTWESVAASTRGVCEVLRALAGADASVTLVSSMHPAVLCYWLASSDSTQPAWEAQRAGAFATAADGARWGTITSEPGSGGDIMRTKTRAVALGDTDDHGDGDVAGGGVPGARYLLTGDKHFGSGLGLVDHMFTTAIVDGEDAPGAYFVTVRGLPDPKRPELRVTAEWDGAGMTATQSHAARLESMPAVRLAWDGPIEQLAFAAGPPIGAFFVAVVLGILDEAIALAREQVGARRETLRAYEQVEWSRAELAHWLAVQAYEGALRAVEAGDADASLRAVLRAKAAIADLAEHALSRVTRVLGGGTFSHRSPFAWWYEDVRALGFLRPPWGLAYDQLFATSL